MKWTPSDNDRHVLEALKAEQDKEASATEFVRFYLPFGPAKWSKILNAIDPESKTSYFDEIKSPEAELARLRVTLDGIPLARARRERVELKGVMELKQFRAIGVAVEEAKAEPGPERLIKYLAPTGGGKTMLCNYLSKRFDARIVEVRESWRRSYFTVLEDISSAIGCRIGAMNRPASLEDKLVEACSASAIVLAMDEAEFFGHSALNGIKLLLNKTRLVPVICAIEEAHAKWNGYFPLESAQLDRRTHAVVRLKELDPDDVKLFFTASAFKDQDKAIALITEKASRFGHYSLIKRVAIHLHTLHNVGMGSVEKAINSALEEMNRLPVEAAA
jgi:hypothetical protein